MNEKYLYLLLNLGAISVPLIASFYPKAPFYKTWNRVIPALILPLMLFVVWDVWFTDMGVWGFNNRYLSGIYIINLPLEEWLFFIAIPYACLFTYFALKHFKIASVSPPRLLLALGLVALLVGVGSWNQWYTMTTFIGLGLTFLFLYFKRWPFLYQFLISYMVILVPFFLINGVLTGSWIEEQVVWYNDLENFGIRMGTIPVEDAFYGMLLLLLNTIIWEGFQYPTKMKGAQ